MFYISMRGGKYGFIFVLFCGLVVCFMCCYNWVVVGLVLGGREFLRLEWIVVDLEFGDGWSWCKCNGVVVDCVVVIDYC